ncbi:DUF2851 family protein [Christiangramia aquimixticola]|uniref:DUF2851 family protein n=1 Tax=Christiangramia aquimixticola TaxID=1697558 RepID=UPI003AA7DDF2
MKEEFLYFLWKFKKFGTEALKTSAGQPISIFDPGTRNLNSGPDFFNARIQIGDQLWAGNVEMHINSSDWYLHHHQLDPNYENVILHVVWNHDEDVFRKNSTAIPVLELSRLVKPFVLHNYLNLLETAHNSLNCEQDFPEFDQFKMDRWLERLYFERLEKKAKILKELFDKTANDWEATCFVFLCQSFGLNINGENFKAIAQSFDFKIWRKLKPDLFSLEALLLGQAGLIKGEDKYALDLRKEFEYLKVKYQLCYELQQKPEFFRLRPDNFPSIRLAQIAALYHFHDNLFQRIIDAKDVNSINEIFKVEVSDYWKTHYNFSTPHKPRNKKLSKKFIDLLIINFVIPLKFVYANYIGADVNSEISDLLRFIKKEDNSIVKLYNQIRPGTAVNALQSQALVQLKREYCDRNNCLQCELGASILNKFPKYV